MIGLNARRSDAQYTFYCDNMSGLISSPHCELMRPSHSNDFVWIKDLNVIFKMIKKMHKKGKLLSVIDIS